VALQSAAMYTFMYQCMLRAVDVTRANLWVEDVTFVPAKAGFHSGGVQLLVVLDKNRKRTLAGSMTFARNTDDGLALLPLLEQYYARMGWNVRQPPQCTPLFPRISDDGLVTGPYYTNRAITRRMRKEMLSAGVPNANKYCLSGFRPGGHTDLLIATRGDHGVADGVARWDTAAAERRYDRRDADAWLTRMEAAAGTD
jgi:hypothetical protein